MSYSPHLLGAAASFATALATRDRRFAELGYHNYGYAPSGVGGIVLLVLIILLLTGRL